jgi:adenylate cyclase
MSDIFISYARSTESQAKQIADALRSLGYKVWRDDEIPAHRSFAEVIEERLSASKAVVVVWSAEATASQWVCSEANRARADRKLVQLRVDATKPPMPFDQIQCADLTGWDGRADHPDWTRITASVRELVGDAAPRPRGPETVLEHRPSRASICVLPFANMSGDPEQEYFSDGISEDVITDLSKVSALFVIARNTAFTFKSKNMEVPHIARQLNVGHVLEGSVRKAGARVRITAQLVDGITGGQVWAERYDRDLDDIFALQDEISEAIVRALKLKLLPEERKAIERRGTDNVDAYDLYLMARRRYFASNLGDSSQLESVIRLCGKAVEIDPTYALAWATMARAQTTLRRHFQRRDIDSSTAIEKALALDPDLAEAHAVKAINLQVEGRYEEAFKEIETALRLDPECYDANISAAYLYFNRGRIADAIPYFEKAAGLLEADPNSPSLLITCYTSLGDMDGARHVARITISRAEAILAQDRSNGWAMSYCVRALAALGEADQARDWIRRALLIDPDNQLMRYNLASALCVHLRDIDGALDLLGPHLAQVTRYGLDWVKTDPDMAPLRDDPRFQAIVADAEERLARAEAGEA